jgi:hypothetical protein
MIVLPVQGSKSAARKEILKAVGKKAMSAAAALPSATGLNCLDCLGGPLALFLIKLT